MFLAAIDWSRVFYHARPLMVVMGALFLILWMLWKVAKETSHND